MSNQKRTFAQAASDACNPKTLFPAEAASPLTVRYYALQDENERLKAALKSVAPHAFGLIMEASEICAEDGPSLVQEVVALKVKLAELQEAYGRVCNDNRELRKGSTPTSGVVMDSGESDG